MKRHFKSSEDFTKPVVQIEIIELDGTVYIREWRKMSQSGKTFKVKKAWQILNKTLDDMCAARRNGIVYKLIHEKRFLYSVQLKSNVGPRI